MTDQPTPETTPTASDDATPEAQRGAVIGLTDGAYTIIVGVFGNTTDAEAAYQQLTEIERNSRYRIDGVVVASRDAQGKVHLGKVTEHSTKTGLKWGIVGGVALGILFPPTVLAGAAAGGALGSAIGKVRNVARRSALGDELETVMEPNTSSVIALVEDTAVVEIERALARADEIVTRAVDKQVAAEIDREAAAAKAALRA
ncbi:MAG TPA: DUF1269 domain-containing protein [Candidatus Limnocylindrales bacterium]|nr:DUF1269 domain-containing protein [Candidatus Limnocylindrales bacterium]